MIEIITVSTLKNTMASTDEFCAGYGDGTHVIQRVERSVVLDLDKYKLSDEIKNQASVIYTKMRPRTRRGKLRNKLLFYITYCAHLELGLNVNPSSLGKMFGLNQGEIQSCNSLFSFLQTGYRPPVVTISPVHLLPDLCKKLDFSDEGVAAITQLGVRILQKDPTLYQENPQTVAAGLLRYYTIINGLDDLCKVEIACDRSPATIEPMYDRIARIDNLVTV